MPDLFYLIRSWWKQMLLTVAIATITVAIILFFIPSKYLAVATALPANSYATDKGSVFSQNTQTLYPALGTPEDLDMILGTAHLDTVYMVVAAKYQLATHYHVKEQGQAALRKAAHLLKKTSSVAKSEYNELKVKVWDVDPELAPQLVNNIVETVQAIQQDIQNRHNLSVLASVQTAILSIRSSLDSLTKTSQANHDEGAMVTASRTNALNQLQQYQVIENQYKLIVENRPQALVIVERAHVSDWPDTPDRLLIIVATFVLGIFLSILIALLLEKRKQAV